MVITTVAFYVIAFKAISAGFKSPAAMTLVSRFKLDNTGTQL
jgi:hypothetical protein